MIRFAFVFIFVCSIVTADDPLIDGDGNTYPVVRVGEQLWMAENLRTTSMIDGTPITENEFGSNWNEANFTVPKYQWAATSDLAGNYEMELPFDFYGAVYNEAAVLSGQLVPAGWRLPSIEDINQLRDAIANDGHVGNEGTALKAVEHWFDGTPGTDIYGFNALPAGYVASTGGATGAPIVCHWATSEADTPQTPGAARTVFCLTAFDTGLPTFQNSILLGAGIRFVKDVADILIGDVNCDGAINLLDVDPFVDSISNGDFNPAADINQDGKVDLLDVGPFVALLAG